MSKKHHENDPLAIVDQLETDAQTDNAPYRKRIEKLMATALKQIPIDDAHDAKTLRRTNAGATLEMAARATGFALGFEHAMAVLSAKPAKGGA